jgi:hypothetical protein
MLTDNYDGTIDVRLHPSAPQPVVTIREPTALEYARFRHAMRDIDRQLDEDFSIPPAPVIPTDMPLEEARLVVARYAAEQGKVLTVRKDAVSDPEKAPYAHVVLDVLSVLGGVDADLSALPVEAFSSATCGAMLGVWETPLGGLVDAETSTPDPAPEPAPSPDVPVPASVESEASSPPGTEPVSLSPPEPLTP